MPLLNSFIDAIVCVGFNSERGLTIDQKTSFLQPYVLAILSADQAVYTQSKEIDIIDPCYPPSDHPNSHSIRRPANRFDRSTPSPSLISKVKPHKKLIIPAALKNLPLFCCPDGVEISYNKEEDRIHHIVFTQEDGKRTYGLALTVQQIFNFKTDKPDDEGTYQIDNVKPLTTNTRQSGTYEIPTVSLPQPMKPHTKKMPPSYIYTTENSSRQTQPNNSNTTVKQQYESETPAPQRNLLNLTRSITPPSTQMVRTNSFTSLSGTSSMTNGTSRMQPRSNSTVSLSRNKSNSVSSMLIVDTSKSFYLPHCLVLVSSQPYWIAMHEMISIIHDEILRLRIEPSSDAYRQLIEKYAFFACNTPVPPIPCERFSLSFNLTINQSVLTFIPPINTNRPVLDLDLSNLLLTLNVGKLLDVLAAIFTQQSIIFFCSNYSKLVTTLECLLSLIYPLKWIHIYIPLVPDTLSYIYLEGPPGSYIMGVHSRHQTAVEKLNLSLTCNLDNNTNVSIPEDMEFYRIPPSARPRFINSIAQLNEDIKKDRLFQNVHSPIRLSIDQQREFERQHRTDINHKIIEIFLDLIVDLCGDTLKPIYWKINHQHTSPKNTLTRISSNEQNNSIHSQKTIFSSEKYLLSKTEGDERNFYRTFVHTSAFHRLMEEEMTSTVPTEFRKICQLRSQLHQDQLYHFNNISTADQIELTTSLYDTRSTEMLLPLPNWPSDITKHYLDSCIELFTVELQNAQETHSRPVTAVYAYLRGCALLARGHLLDALRDLYLIENPDLFPHNYIETTIVPLLIDACLLNLFLHEPYYIKSAQWKKVHPDPTFKDMEIIDLYKSGNSLDDPTPPPIKTPDEDDTNISSLETILTYEVFSEHVHRLRVTFERETTEILFKALLHWTDNATTTASTNTRNVLSDTRKLNRRWSMSGNTSKETTTIRNNNQQESPTGTLSPIRMNPSVPAKLFELFIEAWQQTNIEKDNMNHYVSHDRKNQEAILMISSSDIVSKKDGPGKLILTQKGIYLLLSKARSQASLLTKLSDIVIIDKLQRKIFLSPKLVINIYASCTTSSTDSATSKGDSEPTVVLIFKDNDEQDFWYQLIFELWSGVSVAYDLRDTNILNKVSRHIALIDTLANIDYNEEIMSTTIKQSKDSVKKSRQQHNQASFKMALNDFLIFTRMRETSSFKTLSAETRNVLTHRVLPSINETEHYAVRCLVFIENPKDEQPSLWCAYGQKLKIFNVKTWICDPPDIPFPSIITCMCLDTCYQLWVGCIDGQLFVVDTNTRICDAQLASIDGEGGCQTIILDIERNHILVANRGSLVRIWNATNCQHIIDINLKEIYEKTCNSRQRTYKSEVTIEVRSTTEESKINIAPSTGPAEVIPTSSDKLKSIQIYENLLFACYFDDYILIFRISDLPINTYTYENIVSVKYEANNSIPINSILVYNKQLWISASYILYIFNINKKNSCDLIMKKPVDEDLLLTMLGFSNYIWAGSVRGTVYVYAMDNYELFKTYTGHNDSVCCLCSILDMYVISGSGRFDTSFIIWKNFQALKDKNK